MSSGIATPPAARDSLERKENKSKSTVIGTIVLSTLGLLAALGIFKFTKFAVNTVRENPGRALQALDEEITAKIFEFNSKVSKALGPLTKKYLNLDIEVPNALLENDETDMQTIIEAVQNGEYIDLAKAIPHRKTAQTFNQRGFDIDRYLPHVEEAQIAAYEEAERLVSEGSNNLADQLVKILEEKEGAEDTSSVIGDFIISSAPASFLRAGDNCGNFVGSNENGPSESKRSEMLAIESQMMFEAIEKADLTLTKNSNIAWLTSYAVGSQLSSEGRSLKKFEKSILTARTAIDRAQESMSSEAEAIAWRYLYAAHRNLESIEIVTEEFDESGNFEETLQNIQQTIELANSARRVEMAMMD